ncbi:hypothetical protein H8959_011633 [Pygathrix nigripes]
MSHLPHFSASSTSGHSPSPLPLGSIQPNEMIGLSMRKVDRETQTTVEKDGLSALASSSFKPMSSLHTLKHSLLEMNIERHTFRAPRPRDSAFTFALVSYRLGKWMKKVSTHRAAVQLDYLVAEKHFIQHEGLKEAVCRM